jgi:large subunit ribosomal protein L7e
LNRVFFSVHTMPAPESRQKAVAAKADAKKGAAASTAKLTPKQRLVARKKALLKTRAKYERIYKGQQTAARAAKKEAKAKGNFYVESEAKLAFVVRIRGINDIAPQPKKILDLLRLKNIFNGTFVRLNKATIEMLKRVGPWVTYGYPTLASVRKLVLKRGFGKRKGQRLPLTNALVREVLGKHGIHSVDDVIHQIYTVGQKFRVANNFLWAFKLSAPHGGMKAKRKHFVEGGDFGNRETFINPFIKQVL